MRIAAETALAAIDNGHQLFTAAFVDRTFAGYMIATVHAPSDTDQPIWLNVIQHNHRPIRFYRKHGFEVVPPQGRTTQSRT